MRFPLALPLVVATEGDVEYDVTGREGGAAKLSRRRTPEDARLGRYP